MFSVEIYGVCAVEILAYFNILSCRVSVLNFWSPILHQKVCRIYYFRIYLQYFYLLVRDHFLFLCFKVIRRFLLYKYIPPIPINLSSIYGILSIDINVMNHYWRIFTRFRVRRYHAYSQKRLGVFHFLCCYRFNMVVQRSRIRFHSVLKAMFNNIFLSHLEQRC